MKANRKNEEIARKVINILADSKCTVEEVTEILAYVSKKVKEISTVQGISEKLFDCED